MLERLAKRKKEQNYRTLTLKTDLIDFASNDYLGLAKRELYPPFKGSTGSRLLTGNSLSAIQLEEKIASFHGYKAALLFNCGYMANLGLLSSFPTEKETIFFDSSIHASFRDGIALSKAKSFPFRHNDLNHLEERLKKPRGGSCYICIESLYSQDGSFSPLKEIFSLSEKWGAKLIVDEAHSTGIFGPQGKGLLAEYNIKPFAHIVTFGKALGAFGAAILGSCELKKGLINFARSFIYTTALPFSTLYAIEKSYDALPYLDSERKSLFSKIALFKTIPSPIQAITIRGNLEVKKASFKLAEKGFDVRPLLSPTVRRGEEKLRITLHSFNTEEEVKTLLEAL